MLTVLIIHYILQRELAARGDRQGRQGRGGGRSKSRVVPTKSCPARRSVRPSLFPTVTPFGVRPGGVGRGGAGCGGVGLCGAGWGGVGRVWRGGAG